MFGFSVYSAILVVHVFTAAILVGSTMMWPSVLGAMRGAQSIAELRGVMDFLHRALKTKPLVALALLASGIYLGSAGWWSQAWFYVAVGVWIVNSVLAATVIERSVRALVSAVATTPDGTVTANVDRLRTAAPLQLAAAVMTANDIMLLYVMFAKPELVACLVLAAIAQAVAVTSFGLRRRRLAPGVGATAPPQSPQHAIVQ